MGWTQESLHGMDEKPWRWVEVRVNMALRSSLLAAGQLRTGATGYLTGMALTVSGARQRRLSPGRG